MQIRIVLSLNAEEEKEINAAYAKYLLEGGKNTKNGWIKKLIKESIE